MMTEVSRAMFTVHILEITTHAMKICSRWDMKTCWLKLPWMYYSLHSVSSLEIIILWEDTFLTFNNSLPKSAPLSHLVSPFSLSACDEFIRKNKNPFYQARLLPSSVSAPALNFTTHLWFGCEMGFMFGPRVWFIPHLCFSILISFLNEVVCG